MRGTRRPVTAAQLQTCGEAEACATAMSELRKALTFMRGARDKLWLRRWWKEARDIAGSALVLAAARGDQQRRLEFARWLVDHQRNADHLLLLGDALAVSGRTEQAVHEWRRARELARRQGALQLSSVAEHRLCGGQPWTEPPPVHDTALKLARTDPRGALALVARERRRAVRRGANRDANDLLRMASKIAQRSGQSEVARRLAKRLVEVAPSGEALCDLADLEAQRGAIGLSERIAARALLRARVEGDLTAWRRAHELLPKSR